jgi:hypothetical protein
MDQQLIELKKIPEKNQGLKERRGRDSPEGIPMEELAVEFNP